MALCVSAVSGNSGAASACEGGVALTLATALQGAARKMSKNPRKMAPTVHKIAPPVGKMTRLVRKMALRVDKMTAAVGEMRPRVTAGAIL